MNRDFKGIWIPKEIWLHEKISMQAKALWSEINSLYNEERGGCFASDDYLMDFLGLKSSRLHEVMKELKNVGLLVTVSFDGRQRILKAIQPNEVMKTEKSVESSLPENRNPEFRKTGTPSYIDKSIEKKKKKKKVAALAIQFNYENNQFENITDQDLTDWKSLYPGIDISRELALMRQWLIDPDNPERDGNRTFITNWLSRTYKDTQKTPRKEKSQVLDTKQVNDDPIYDFNSSIANKVLKNEGEQEYIRYLKCCNDKSHYHNYLKTKNLQEL